MAHRYTPQDFSEDTLPDAVKSGNLEIVSFAIDFTKKQIERGINDGTLDESDGDDIFIDCLSGGLEEAVERNYSPIIDFLIDQGAEGLHMAIFTAAINGNKKMITKLISQMNSDDAYWSLGMAGAARGGHKELIDYSISLGATDYNHAMSQAAAGGHLNIIDYMISKGASEFGQALGHAISFDQFTSIKYLLSIMPDDVVEVTVAEDIPMIISLDNPKMYKLLHRWIQLTPEDLNDIIVEGRGKTLREVLKTSPPIIITNLINLTDKHLNVIIQLINYQIKQAKEFKNGAFRNQLSQLYG